MGKLSRQIYHRRSIKSAKIRTFSAFLEKYFFLSNISNEFRSRGATYIDRQKLAQGERANRFLPDLIFRAKFKNAKQKGIVRRN